MPRIIENIELTILEAAARTFSENGYNKSEMKVIAKTGGIAVGTLYNYYPNKKMLYRDVFFRSWNSTIKKLEAVSLKEKKEHLREQIDILYAEIEKRNGLGIDFRTFCKQGDKEFEKVAKVILGNLIEVTLKRFDLKDEFTESNELYVRIIIIWITSQFELISDFPNQKEENLQVLFSIVSNFFNF